MNWKRIRRYTVIALLVSFPVWADTLLQGVTGTKAEVEPNFAALRVTPRPINVGSLGSYSVAATSGTIAAGMAANGAVYSFRWTHASNLALIRSVRIGSTSLVTGFTAGSASCGVIFARGFTASDSGGTAITLTGNSMKRRTTFGTSLVGDMRISSTAALTAGTRTLDANDLSIAAPFTVTAAAQTAFIPANTILWDRQTDGEWPLVLAQNEGFIVRCTVPATGTWSATVTAEWTELVPGTGTAF